VSEARTNCADINLESHPGMKLVLLKGSRLDASDSDNAKNLIFASCWPA